MDSIIINDLSTRCIIGINEEERREKQDVVINLTIRADIGRACKSDKFEDTVDYRAIKKRILAAVEDSHYYLIEALAQTIADICLEHPLAFEVRVKVEKPAALRFARSVGIEIERKKRNQ
jgi:FolB domain-containing protein